MRTLGAATTLILSVSSAAAQGIHPQFAIGLGRSFPSGAFRSDTTGEGFVGAWVLTGHAILRPPVSLGKFLLRIDATYARHGANGQLKADLTSAFGQPSDERMSLLGLDASAVYPIAPASRFAPSVFAGLGVWHSTVTVTTGGSSNSTSATKLGWQLGAEVTRGPVFLDLRYVSVAAGSGYPGTSFFPLTLGYRFGTAAR